MGRLLASLALGLLAGLSAAAPARAQGAKPPPPSKRTLRRREARLKKVARKLRVPLGELRRVEGWRWGARRVAVRRALWKNLVRRPLPGLVPLVVEGALKEPDLDCRYTAVALLSVIGLGADRAEYLQRIHAAYPRLYADRYEQVWKDASKGATVLGRWFDLDQEIVKLLVRVYDGKHYRLAQEALRGLLQLRNPALRKAVVARVIRELIDPKTRFGVFERRLAIAADGARRGPVPARALADMIHTDGTVAVAIAKVLGPWGDRSALPALRRIGRTSAHVLRTPVLRARGQLNDAELLALVEPTFKDDHENMRRALVEALGYLKHPAVPKVLRRLAKVESQDALLADEVALAQLRQGEQDALARLKPKVSGGAPDAKLAGRVLRLDLPITTPLLVAMANTSAAGFEGRRRRAIEELGVRKAAGVAPIASGLAAGDAKTPLRLSAAIALLQLRRPGAAERVRQALAGFEVVLRENVPTKLGTARRYRGSHLSRAVARLVASESLHAIPLLARWLDPPSKTKRAPAGAKPPAPRGGTSVRRRRRSRKGPRPVRTLPPHLPKFLRHQFVRRDVTAALADLVRLAAAKLEKTPKAAELGAWRERGIAALTRCLDDPRGVVRRAAIRGLARIAKRGPLPPGASLATEAEVEAEVRDWLATRLRGR